MVLEKLVTVSELPSEMGFGTTIIFMKGEAKQSVPKMHLFRKIENYIANLDTSLIPQERKELLDLFAETIRAGIVAKKPIRLNFICTHNSRRSHLGQVWAKAMAAFYGHPYVKTYSGGTEATAIFPSVLRTLENIGFETTSLSETPNPVISIVYAEMEDPIIAFSKKYEHPFNPQADFIAIMTCSSADEKCPIVHGSTHRLPIKYLDPKISDGTPEEAASYFERSEQIAREMKYVFSQF